MVKKILWVVLILGVTGVSIGYYMWTKPKRNIAAATADITISADSLYLAYEQDEKKANAKFLNKVIVVSGGISEISINQNKETVAVLSAPSGMMGGGVGITFLKSDSANYSSLKKDDKVMMKGLCTGYTFDVVLTNGSIVK